MAEGGENRGETCVKNGNGHLSSHYALKAKKKRTESCGKSLQNKRIIVIRDRMRVTFDIEFLVEKKTDSYYQTDDDEGHLVD